MVEPQIVVLVVAGSSPVGHPISILDLRLSIVDLSSSNRKSEIENFTVPVAQPDRASDFGSEGWGFESLQARHFLGFCRRYVALICRLRRQDHATTCF